MIWFISLFLSLLPLGDNVATLTAEQVAQVAYQAGWRGEDLVKAVAIAKRESGYRPDAHRTDTDPSKLSGDRGLFQINYVHDANLIQAGIIKAKADLFNPLVNAKAAFFLYGRSNNTFAPWTAASGGWTAGGDPLYGTNVTAARDAVSSAGNKGLFGGALDWLNDIPVLGGPLGTPIDPGNLIGGVGDAIDFMQSLTKLSTWIRVLQVVGGAVLIWVGLQTLVSASLDINAADLLSGKVPIPS